jgi:hypothetical protein
MSLEIDFIDDNDVMFRCGDCGDMSYLSTLINNEVKNTEKYLCEANAKDFYKIICVLELKAYEMRKTYDKWKQNDFSKEEK